MQKTLTRRTKLRGQWKTNEPKNSTKGANTKITKNAANIKNTIKVTEKIPGAYIPAPEYKSVVFT